MRSLYKIITCSIISLLALQEVIALPNIDRHREINLAKFRAQLIKRIQDDFDRLQNRRDSLNDKKSNKIINLDNDRLGQLRIDTAKKDLHATIISREEDSKSNKKSQIKQHNMSKIEMESKATEINIEHKLNQLQQENDSLK